MCIAGYFRKFSFNLPQHFSTASTFAIRPHVFLINWASLFSGSGLKRLGMLPNLLHELLFFPVDILLFWHSCLNERKHPTLTSYSRIPQLQPSDCVLFAAATWSDSVCRICSHSQPHDKSHAVSGHMESPSSVYMFFHFC